MTTHKCNCSIQQIELVGCACDPLFAFMCDYGQHMVDFHDAQHNEHYHEYCEMLADAAECATEAYAEKAWLRAAEAPTNDDLGFEAWESARCLS